MAEQQRPDRPTRKPNRPGSPNGSNPAGGMRFGRGLMGWFLFIGLVLMMVWLLNNQKRSQAHVAFSEVFHHLDQLRAVELDGDEMSGSFITPIAIPVLSGGTQPVGDFVTSLAPDWHPPLSSTSACLMALKARRSVSKTVRISSSRFFCRLSHGCF